jgi:DNA mismatch endonuclease (patch repair protein)
MGFRFRLHKRDLPGRPDLVLSQYRAAIFVHGCFWHQHPGCAYATVPKTRKRFWLDKLNGNRERDTKQIALLIDSGWRVLVVWECALRKKDLSAAVDASRWIRSKSTRSEIAAGSGKPLR